MSHVYLKVFLTLLSFFYTTFGGNNLFHNQETQIYIVSIQNNLKPFDFSNVDEWYKSILTKTNSNSNDSLIHVYKTVFHGFSARLKPEQAYLLRAQVEVIEIFPNKMYQLHTTRTPHFLGLDTYHSPLGLLKDSDLGSNVVVGVLDTGIWPENPSFNDEDMGPIPPHFKGKCDGGENFPPSLCNKKIVGVRYFQSVKLKQPKSARDDSGHGTHTASTIAGRTRSQNSSFFGYATGEITGIAPKARLSIYKVCWSSACFESDVLAGIDKAVEDGVDVISVSLGNKGDYPLRYTLDIHAIGAFGAFQKGVFFSASAGNSGTVKGYLSNNAPWITTVGASTIDRTFPADVILDNGVVLTGSSLYTGDPLPENRTFPIVHFESDFSMRNCLPGSLDEKYVKGKIVVCNLAMSTRVEKGVEVQMKGGVGVIVAMNDPSVGENDTVKSDAFMIPGLTIPWGETLRLISYINKKEVKAATIVFQGTRIGENLAPVVASFSSRGPNRISKYVLKPDMIAPGVDILAGWPNDIPPSGLGVDPRRSEFNIKSGTSMACPHVSGLAALLKGAHPDWTPAMIRSALMTTAYSGYHEMSSKRTQNPNQLSYWDMGAGHVNPEKANQPGLVYDISEDDFIQFLCASNYKVSEIQTIVRRSVSCDDKKKINEWDLNYPALVVSPDLEGKTMVRTLTSVESSASSYTVKVVNPKGVNVTVSPLELSFKNKGEKQSFLIKVSMLKIEGYTQNKNRGLGSVTWTDGKRNVTIPLMWYKEFY